MSNAELPVLPLSEVREVVETFRYHHVAQHGWTSIFEHAIASLNSADLADFEFADIARMVEDLRMLLAEGLDANDALVASVADETTEILRVLTPAGIPRPEDADWSFPPPSIDA